MKSMEENQFDTIIIGSGISGMTAAIIQAREGEKVLVLEQHSIPGGLTQTYRRQRITFPTGVHRLGSLAPNQPLWYYFNYLGLLDKLDLVPLSSNCFEKFHFPDGTYPVPMGHDAFEQQLINDFPSRRKPILQYFKDMKRLIAGIGLYDPNVSPEKDLSFEYTGSLEDYFTTIGIHGRLKNILCANSPLYGLSSLECPVLTHFLICDSYLNSSFRINEFKTPFAGALVKSFETQGGKIRTNSQVETILIKDKQSRGVKLTTGESLFSDKIIYSGHPSLLPGLCPSNAFRPVYRKRLQTAKNTKGIFAVALGWEKNNCPVAANDAYIYNSWDVNDHYKQNSLLGTNLPEMIFLSALPHEPNTKKSDSQKNDPKKSDTQKDELAVTALVELPTRDSEELQTYYQMPGKKKYREAKQILSEKIMEKITAVYPDTPDHVRMADTYSPATFERYTLTPKGSAYGIKKTAQNFLQGIFKPATRVKNLFLTGQSIGFSGIHGSLISSVNLCNELNGKSYLTGKILNQPINNKQVNNQQENKQPVAKPVMNSKRKIQ